MSIITSSLYNCYDYIIGISATECDCYNPKGDYALDFNTSYSGLFLDELASLGGFFSLGSDCNGTLWEIADNCRTQAIKIFVSNVGQEILKRAKLKQRPFYGIMGRRKHDSDRSITETYAGVQWYCKAIKSGRVTIKKIHTLFSQTGTIDLMVYNNFNELITTLTLNTTQDTFTENDITDLELSLYSDYIDNLQYFFVYQVAGNQPRNNELSCIGCTRRKLTFNPNRPYFNWSQSDRNGWANFVMCGSVVTNTLEFMDTEYGGNDYMNGLIFDVEFQCNYGEVLCMDEFDFVSDPLAISTALAIRYKAAEIFADKIFASHNNFGFGKLVNREDLATNQGEWRASYKELVEYIGKKADINKNDCFVCDDFNRIGRDYIRL